MAAEALQPSTSPARSRWHNHIPAWVPQDRRYQELKQGPVTTMQAIADSCDPPNADGSLLTAFEGQSLYDRARCCKNTFRSHIQHLGGLGFVVFLGRVRGGPNQWGIPGHPGALNHLRARRPSRRRVRDADGQTRYEVLRPGEQLTLDGIPPPPEVVQNLHYPSAKSALPQCKICPLPSWSPSPSGKHHGVSPARRRKKRIRHVELEDLTDTTRLLEVFADSCRRGVVENTEADRLRFVGAAVRSLRVGQDPRKVFASIVNHGRWLFVTQAEEEEAHRRIREHLHGELPPRKPETERATGRRLSTDAMRVAAGRQWAASVGHGGGLLGVIQRHYPEWTRERYDQAVAELDATR